VHVLPFSGGIMHGVGAGLVSCYGMFRLASYNGRLKVVPVVYDVCNCEPGFRKFVKFKRFVGLKRTAPVISDSRQFVKAR
jgi:hypothetical protein